MTATRSTTARSTREAAAATRNEIAKTASAFEKIEERRWIGSQGFFLNSLYKHTATGKMVRIDIEVDSYRDQSHARADFLTTAGWQHLYSIPAPQMTAWLGDKVSKYSTITDQTAVLNADCAALLKMADTLLNAL